MPSTVWSELYARRSEWAIDAYRGFVAKLHPSLREDLARQDYVSMVAYGPTQVGKTTLILTTLGVQKHVFEHVEDVLRGGQQIGKSATVHATRYGKSRDQGWWLGECGPYSAEEMQSELGAVRRRMERGEDVGNDVVDVRIPRSHFVESRNLDVSIIDLPGAHASNQAEVKHVQRLAERYVPVADVVLLVTRVDHLGSLHPAALALECLRDWAAQPAKFRVVLTHTFSAASVRDWLGRASNGGDAGSAHEVSAGALREKLYRELSTHHMPLPPAGERCLFPLEFGKSWADLSAAEGEYFSKASIISTAVMAELIAGLYTASNPYRRLAAAFDMNALVQRKRERLETEHKLKRVRMEGLIEEARQGLEVAKKGRAAAIAERDRSEGLRNYVTGSHCFVALSKQVEDALSVRVDPPREATKRALLHAALTHEDALISNWRGLDFDDPTCTTEQEDGDHGPTWLAELMRMRPSMAPDVEEAYGEFRQAVNGRFGGDMYLTWMPGSSYEEDCALLHKSAEAATSIATIATLKWVKAGLKVLSNTAAHSVVVSERNMKEGEKKIEEFGRAQDGMKEALAAHTQAYVAACEAMQESIVRSEGFHQHMAEGYRRRDDTLTHEIGAERSPARRFLLIALRDLHRKEYVAAVEGHGA